MKENERVAKRFEKYFRRGDGCWEWVGPRFASGYGAFHSPGLPRRTLRAHRVAWELFRCPIPDGLYVLHRCDNPPCVNPDHLFLGSMGDNNRDCVAKGRHRTRRGEDVSGSKLTNGVVQKIRVSLLSNHKLARRINVSVSTVRRARIGQTWAHVK